MLKPTFVSVSWALDFPYFEGAYTSVWFAFKFPVSFTWLNSFTCVFIPLIPFISSALWISSLKKIFRCLYAHYDLHQQYHVVLLRVTVAGSWSSCHTFNSWFRNSMAYACSHWKFSQSRFLLALRDGPFFALSRFPFRFAHLAFSFSILICN